MIDVRVIDGAEGRYVHTADLAGLLKRGQVAADPIMAAALPRILELIDMIGEMESVGRPTPAVRYADPHPDRHGWV